MQEPASNLNEKSHSLRQKLERVQPSIFLFFLTFFLLFLVHRHALAPHLRHCVVQDGQVSQFAGDFLGEGSIGDKYANLMQSDGEGTGRYRPIYYVYETVPFFLTMVKNGHYGLAMSQNDLPSHINGDLRFHLIFLLTTVGLALALIAMACRKISGSLIYSALIPVAVVLSPGLIRNITYSDTSEVPQLLGLALYLYCFVSGLVALKNNRLNLISLFGAAVSLIIVYLIKETSIAIAGFATAACVISSLPHLKSVGFWRSARFRFYVSHIAMNLILFAWVLGHSMKLRVDGAYTDHYQARTLGGLGVALEEYGLILWRSPLACGFAIVGLLVILGWSWSWLRRKHPARYRLMEVASLSLASMLLALAFLAGNLSWEFVLARYMLPVFVAGTITGALCLGFIDEWWKVKRLPFRRYVLLFTVLIWTGVNGISESKQVSQSYEYYFGANRMLDPIVDFLVDTPELQSQELDVCLEVGKQSWNLWYQVARVLNQEHGINVHLPDGMRPDERLYLRHYPGAPTITLYPADSPSYAAGAYDWVFAAVPNDPKEKAVKVPAIEAQLSIYKKVHVLDLSEEKGDPGYVIWVLRSTKTKESL